MDDDAVLAEQRAYYKARPAEYDEWWQRRGRFDRGPESAEEWDREVALVQLHSIPLARRVTSWS